MAEAILFDLAAGILRKSGSRGVQEIGAWWNVKDELETLRSTVSTIQAVLLDAEEKYYSESNAVRVWVGKLRETFYDADDLLDDFSTMALRRQVHGGNKLVKEVSFFFSSSNQIAYGIKMGRKIKAIRDRLDEIAAERMFHLVERPMETSMATAQGHDQTHSSLPEVIVGRDDDKKKIINLLFSSDYEDNVVVIPIIGIGGLGKTTLTQLVYNDEEVKKQFELRLWVCVSDVFDVKLIAEKIVESATREKPRNLEMNTVKDILLETIHDKRYLLVLDDVWNDNMEKWSRLKALLSGGPRGSRIVITSRLRRVAEITSTIPPYELQGLLENESWTLFAQMAFKKGSEPRNPGQEMIGKDILEKCKGVPLAIKTIGRLLFFKDSESEWLSFKNVELPKIKQHEDDIFPTLKLGYNVLPAHLKKCFAYCGLFPKDECIEVKKIIDLWKAQGYMINPCNSVLSPKDIDLTYCTDLVGRSFLEIDEKDESGNLMSIKMHDLMHDLATFVAGPMNNTLSVSSSTIIDENTRHISFNFDSLCSQGQVLSSLFKASKLRTILFPSGDWRPQIGEEQCHAIFSNCKCLRVLDLHCLGVKIVPRSIDQLKHLRYLDLSNNEDLEMLPNSVSKLQNLEVLKLDWCIRLQELPRDINKLVNLRRLCLIACDCLTHMPPGIGQLTKLQELSRFVVGKEKNSSGLAELSSLNLLQDILQIRNLQYVRKGASELKEVNLKEKKHIEFLILSWADGDRDCLKWNNAAEGDEKVLEELHPHSDLRRLVIDGYRGLNFPSWVSSLTNLTSIRLIKCKRLKCVPQLHDLPSLIRLIIEGSTDLEYIQGNFPGSGFTQFPASLKFIKLSDCPNLKGWWPSSIMEKSVPEFSCLSNLHVDNCPTLTSLPLYPPLRTLSLRNTGLLQIFKTLPLSNSISFHPKVETADPLPEDFLQNLISLEEFSIYGDWGVQILTQALCQRHLTSLKTLSLGDCEELSLAVAGQDLDDDILWQGFHRLSFVSIDNISKMASFPKGFQCASNLRYLNIIDCPSLMCLPEWIGKLFSLKSLRIDGCPQLSRRCRSNASEDWHLIAHIPNITIDRKDIQRYGRYKL